MAWPLVYPQLRPLPLTAPFAFRQGVNHRTMYDQVLAALKDQQLNQAANLLKQWQQAKPQDPWLAMATANYWEARENLDKAQVIYTRLLQSSNNSKILRQARDGIQRVRDQLARRREHEIQAAKHRSDIQGSAVLVLAPVMAEQRETAIQGLAQVMRLDLYTARMRLSSKHWRLLRVGAAGEIQYFWEQLQTHHTPAQWLTIDQVKSVSVFRIQQVQSFLPRLRVVCQNGAGQQGTIAIDWAEVSQWIVGQVPIFESVIDLAPWGKLKRKDVTQDYAEVVDLHIQKRGCVLRFCDRTYSYRDSVHIPGQPETPSSGLVAATYWKTMKALFRQNLPAPDQDFHGFGEGALDYMDLLPRFVPYLDLSRSEPSAWDSAFHLYSCLQFLRLTQ